MTNGNYESVPNLKVREAVSNLVVHENYQYFQSIIQHIVIGGNVNQILFQQEVSE